MTPKPSRTQQMQARQGGTNQRLQAPAPNGTSREWVQRPEPEAQHTLPRSHSAPITQKPSLSSVLSPVPQQGRQPSLRGLNQKLAGMNKQCSEIQMRLYMEQREATPDEQKMLNDRAALIAQRNEVRDGQLDALLAALAPMENIHAPQATNSYLGIVQKDAIQQNRNQLLKAKRKFVNKTDLARHYARAERRLESLKESGAPSAQILRLQRMMQGYNNMLALEQIVKSTDDQLEQMGSPRLMDSIPTTAKERQLSFEKALDAHQEAIDNGYL
ncbi:type III secretion protein [Xanthomonas fragariae]